MKCKYKTLNIRNLNNYLVFSVLPVTIKKLFETII